MSAINQSTRICMALLTAAMLWVSGCAATGTDPAETQASPRPDAIQNQAPQSLDSGLPAKPDAEPQPASNSYYHYIEAQLQANRGNLEGATRHLKAAYKADPGVLYLKKELAVLYLHRRDYQKALEIVEQILAAEPEAVDVLFMEASIHQVLETDVDVIPIYEKILSIDPEREEAYKILGKLYMEDGELDKAADVFDRMVSRFPKAYVGHYHLGKVYAQLGRLDEAEAAFERTIELAPSLNQPRWELIKLYQSRGNDGKTRTLYEEILEQNPDNIAAAIELSLACYDEGKTEKADRILGELGRRSAEDAGVVRTLMQRLVIKERYSDALTALKGMREGAPDDPGLQYASGVVYFNMDQPREAVTAFKAVPPESSFYLNAVIHRGIIAYQQEELDEAIEIMRDALESFDEEGKREIIPYLSSFYQQKGSLETAEELVRQGLEINPKDTDLLFELGVLYDKQQRSDAAMETMQQVLEIDPDHADALNYVGYTYADKGIHLDQAEEMIRRALEQKPENGYIIDSLGWLYYQREMYEKAMQYIEQAARLVPDDPIVLEHLGDVYVKLNKPQKALDSYQQALELGPEDPDKLKQKMQVLKISGP